MSTSENFYIGLDVGRTIRGALVSADGKIVKQQKIIALHEIEQFFQRNNALTGKTSTHPAPCIQRF